jgi:hypothetical protein
MEKKQEVQESLQEVIRAAEIHVESLQASLTERYSAARNNNESFKAARRGYINKVTTAIRELRALKLEEGQKIKERVRDLSLEESVDLLFAVENHIRGLRSLKVSEFQ